MGSRRNITDRQMSLVLDDPVDTEEWHCALGLLVEKNPSDCNILSQFPIAAFRGLRQEIRSIDYDADVMRIIKQFLNGAIDYKYSFLLNFSYIFEEAGEVVKKGEQIPVHLLVKIVKAMILFHKKNDLERRERKRLYPYDPIQTMAARPAVINGNKKGVEKLNKRGAGSAVKLKPPSGGKEDTKLLKRGEGSKEYAWIDDAPVNSYYQMYFVLTGFHDPNFPLELIKARVNLSSMICMDASPPNPELCNNSFKHRTSQSTEASSNVVKHFWDEFLKIIWSPAYASYFKDTIFQVYAPDSLPAAICELQEFLYNEISFLMYDLADLKRQHTNYIEHLILCSVTDEEGEKIEQVSDYLEELDALPAEYISVPVVLQYILDVLCGEDDLRDNDMHKINYASLESEEPSIYTKKTGSSVITRLSSPMKYSDVFAEDVRNPIYQKIKLLDIEYGLADEKTLFEYLESHKTLSYFSDEISVLVPKQRLFAENLEEALRAGRKQNFVTSCWKKHEFCNSGCSYSDVKFPPIIMDYCLYVLWLSKVECPYSKAEEKFKNNGRKFSFPDQPCSTITETARRVLNKHDGFFSSPDLKIVNSSRMLSSIEIKPENFISDFNIPNKYLEVEMNVYEDLRSFLGEDIFADENGFEFIEEFSKSKMEEILEEAFADYNCVDCTHSALTDSIFLVLHKRVGDDGVQRGSYNASLRTAVGLRDFYDYVIDDEKDWINENEEIYKGIQKSEMTIRSLAGDFRNFSDSDFIMENSLKSQKRAEASLKSVSEIRKEISEITTGEIFQQKSVKMFTGYDVSQMAVQISGLNSYFSASDNCSVSVELQERLYGKQELRMQIRQGGHVLYLYSYVCPQPHLFDPYTCHILYKNGIVLAFTRRTNETFIEVEEVVPLPPVKAKSKKSMQERSSIILKRIPVMVKDEDYAYDMKLSFPTGLTIETVRKIVEPCYIKQSYLIRSNCYPITVQNELSRLFLPNGDLIKMMSDNTVQILRGNAAIVNTYAEPEIGTFLEKTTPSGEFCRMNDRNKESCRRFEIFETIDVETNVIYFRRTDGTNYSLYPDGTFCVYFKDGTRMSTSFYEHYDDEPAESVQGEGKSIFEDRGSSRKWTSHENPDEYRGENDYCNYSEEKFTIVYLKRIFEHPDYATVIYDEFNKEWGIRLPGESVIKATQNGCYSVNLDALTDFNINLETISMSRKNTAGKMICETFVDLTVFNDDDNKNYSVTYDATGSKFIVESNGNCYVDTNVEAESVAENSQRTISEETEPEIENSQRNFSNVGSIDEKESFKNIQRKLSKENRYFVIRRDKSGFELVHKDKACDILTYTNDDTIYFDQALPGPEERRFFVLLNPQIKHLSKWEVKSIIPDFDYKNESGRKTLPSTYGVPPTWMHPFYEKKTKITIPDGLTSRVFVELKKTDFRRKYTSKYKYCKIDEYYHGERLEIEPGVKNIQRMVRKIAADDPGLLHQIYVLAVETEIKLANSPPPINYQKIKYYLEMSEYLNQLKEFHKHSIRYHIVPNYFEHPAGFSWLILQEIIDSFNGKPWKRSGISEGESSETSGKVSTDETIYNLDFPKKNFSDLSYRTDISSKTAPAVMVHRKKDSMWKKKEFVMSKSEPAIKYENLPGAEIEEKIWDFSVWDPEDLDKQPSFSCVFTEGDLDELKSADGSEK